jgi:hypothetical protein
MKEEEEEDFLSKNYCLCFLPYSSVSLSKWTFFQILNEMTKDDSIVIMLGCEGGGIL